MVKGIVLYALVIKISLLLAVCKITSARYGRVVPDEDYSE